MLGVLTVGSSEVWGLSETVKKLGLVYLGKQHLIS